MEAPHKRYNEGGFCRTSKFVFPSLEHGAVVPNLKKIPSLKHGAAVSKLKTRCGGPKLKKADAEVLVGRRFVGIFIIMYQSYKGRCNCIFYYRPAGDVSLTSPKKKIRHRAKQLV